MERKDIHLIKIMPNAGKGNKQMGHIENKWRGMSCKHTYINDYITCK